MEEEVVDDEDSSSSTSLLPKTAPSLATARRVFAADPPAVTAGDWGSSAARRSALSSTETRLKKRVEKREGEKAR